LSQLQRAYDQLYFWRKGQLPFTGSIVNSKMFWNGPSMDTDSMVVTNSLSSPINAFSGQQNLCALHHWFQLVAQMLKGRLLLHIENFEQLKEPDGSWATRPDGVSPAFPLDGQEIYSKWLDGFDVTSGKYDLLFDTWDQSSGTITQQLRVIEQDTGDWTAVSTPFVSKFYDPLLTGSLAIVGFGNGSRATFTQGSFQVAHSIGTEDIQYGGYSWNADGSPNNDPIPNLCTDTGETSNLKYTVINPDESNVEFETVGLPV